MPFPAELPAALLETIILHVAALMLPGAKGDMEVARQSAIEILAAYHPRTEAELRLAARNICFSLQSLEALSQAANPDMPLTRVLRLRTGAVSLSREAEKAERRLILLRAERKADQPEQTEPQPESRGIERAVAMVEDNRKVAAYAKANGLTWRQAYQQRRRDEALAARLQKQQAKAAADPVTAAA